jgi:antitoxin (DNA-binding transcriptional repressor) of toxin-antitoxin stability system
MSVTVDVAQANLRELIRQLAPGEEVVLTDNEQPVAKLVGERPPAPKPSRPGPGHCKQGCYYLHGPRLRRAAGGHETVYPRTI